MTDREMLERFRVTRDEDAFEGLVLRHGPMVLGLCRRVLRDSHEAEDAFQATFLLLARNAGAIRDLDSVAGWLYGVAYRIAVRAKAGARRRLVEGRDLAMAVTGTGEDRGEESDRDREEIRPLLRDEVGRLPEKYRAPVVLCFFEGQTHEQAARQLDCPSGTVKGRLARAKALLKARLERRGVTLTVGLLLMLLAEEAEASVSESLVGATVGAALRDGGTVDAVEEARPRRVLTWMAVILVLGLFGRLVGERRRAGAEVAGPAIVAKVRADLEYGRVARRCDQAE